MRRDEEVAGEVRDKLNEWLDEHEEYDLALVLTRSRPTLGDGGVIFRFDEALDYCFAEACRTLIAEGMSVVAEYLVPVRFAGPSPVSSTA